MTQIDKTAIAKAKFVTGQTIAAIAKELSITRRTVERWAEKGNWRALRTQAAQASEGNVIQMAHTAPKRSNPPSVRQQNADPVDLLAIADLTIADLQGEMKSCNESATGKAAIANSLRSWLEFRRKLCPPTAAELAEQVIAHGISPAEFVRELREAWGKVTA